MEEIKMVNLPPGVKKEIILQWIEESKKTAIQFTTAYDNVIDINPQEDADVAPNKDILDDIKE